MNFPKKIGINKNFHYPLSQLEEHPFDMIRGFIQHNFTCFMHRHEFYEINIITSGYGMHYIEDERFLVKRGQVFVIPPMVRHGYICGEGLDVFHLHIHPDYFKQKKEQYCSNCKTKYDFDNDISYQEISSYSKAISRKYTRIILLYLYKLQMNNYTAVGRLVR